MQAQTTPFSTTKGIKAKTAGLMGNIRASKLFFLLTRATRDVEIMSSFPNEGILDPPS